MHPQVLLSSALSPTSKCRTEERHLPFIDSTSSHIVWWLYSFLQRWYWVACFNFLSTLIFVEYSYVETESPCVIFDGLKHSDFPSGVSPVPCCRLRSGLKFVFESWIIWGHLFFFYEQDVCRVLRLLVSEKWRSWSLQESKKQHFRIVTVTTKLCSSIDSCVAFSAFFLKKNCERLLSLKLIPLLRLVLTCDIVERVRRAPL